MPKAYRSRVKGKEKQMTKHEVVSEQEWMAARIGLLAKEKEATRHHDELARMRHQLPWVRVSKDYTFTGSEGKKTLADLFDGRSQLLIYHFMFHPDWEEGCPSCSILGDHIGPSLPHLAAQDVTLAAVSRAPIEKLMSFQKRMGWKFPWVSSYGSSFNYDFHVSFRSEDYEQKKVYYNYKMQEFPNVEAPGTSAFVKENDGSIYHTYSTYGRGGEPMMNIYEWLDLAPKGRQEDGPFPMSWVRHHDRYEYAQQAGCCGAGSH